jgi:O-antigen/teichoic acid export membrane protein
MLLVNSAGIVLVGRMDFVMAGPYAIAMTAATVLVGLLGAVLSPLMTTAAALNANPETRSQLPALLMRSTLGVAVGLNLLALFVTVLHPWILSLWVGESFVSSTGPLLVVLVMANCLRNIGAPYALMLLATGLHKRALISAVFEGVANLLASIIMGFYWGALGVAFGSLLGSFVGIFGLLIMNPSKTPELVPSPWLFLMKTFLLPLMAFMPMHLYLINGLNL